MAKLKTRDFDAVEIMRVGTFRGHGCPPEGCNFTTGDLDALARSATLAGDKFDAPLKLGHNERQKLLGEDGLPSAGWLDNLRRDGDRLLADFKAVPEKVADLIDAGGFRKRSAELTPKFKVDGKTYPWMLTGLALLGEELPAVDSLSDVTELYHSLELELPDDPDARVFLFDVELADDDVDMASIEADIDRFMGRIEARIKGRVGAPTLRQLGRALREGIKAAAARGRRLAADVALVWEETENQIRHSVRAASDFVDGSLRTVPLEGSGGVSVVAGKLKTPPEGKAGSMTTQSLRFDKGQDWTMAKAKAWAGEHDLARSEAALSKEEEQMDEEIRKLLGLAADADVLEAVKKLAKDASAPIRELLELADDADVVAAVRELKAKAAGSGGGGTAVEELRSDLNAATQRVLTLERDAGTREAEDLVDAAIRDTRLLPAQRETAIKMALRDHDSAKVFLESQPKGVVELGERGSPNTESMITELEPTQLELDVNKPAGLTRIDLIRQKAADKGIELPADFGKEKKADD